MTGRRLAFARRAIDGRCMKARIALELNLGIEWALRGHLVCRAKPHGIDFVFPQGRIFARGQGNAFATVVGASGSGAEVVFCIGSGIGAGVRLICRFGAFNALLERRGIALESSEIRNR